MNETDKLIDEQFNKLPAKLQTVIKAIPWKSMINEISLLKSMDLEKVAAIEQETMFVIYGFESPNDYIQNMMREAQIDEETATTIAEAVNEKIFKEISNRVSDEEKKERMMPQESKEDAMRRLSQRMGNVPKVPEIMPPNLPMIEKGETVHDVPHIEPTAVAPESTKLEPTNPKPDQSKPVSAPHYPGGKDPYREPLV